MNVFKNPFGNISEIKRDSKESGFTVLGLLGG